MTDPSKVQLTHTQRAAFVYIRQSTPGQVEHNRESTARQYALADRACQLGWPKEQVVIIDEDLGLSGSSTDKRSGFARLTSEVALAHVGIVLGLEVSRLARNNADWYRLLELCGITDTLIGDSDGVYHPALFNDRLLLGLKGTMSEAELHIIRARLDGGIRNSQRFSRSSHTGRGGSHAAHGRATPNQPRCGSVATASGSRTDALRVREGRAPLPSRGA
jgi:DNA invertase Pin-like site-specific DNA recombinase